MIVVKNTKELEENYDLYRLPDNEEVVVLGGMADKEKYNAEKYIRRVTYPARQIKQIIGQMKEIENSIPNEWNEWQKAKYIYEILGKNIEYNFNREEYSNQQSSNLSILLSKKAICAGYSLLFKEMMDRQNIECEYVRGVAVSPTQNVERHAWNVLAINGENGEKHVFPIDLTWDSGNFQRGETQLKYFGCKEDFFATHNPDQDENRHNFVSFTQESINSIDTKDNIKETEISEQDKLSILQNAIEETYKKFKDTYGTEVARNQINKAIIKHIQEGDTTGFTRQNMAREIVTNNISQEEMRDILINQYIENVATLNKGGVRIDNILGAAIQDTGNKYGKEHVKSAVKNYMLEGISQGFTRDNEARNNMQQFMTPELALEGIVSDYVEKQVSSIEKVIQNGKMQFEVDELAQVERPSKENIIKKSMEWITDKLKNKNQNEQNKIYEDRVRDEQNER